MSGLKTRETGASVEGCLDSIEDPSRRRDCVELLGIMRRATGLGPKMWGEGIFGFGRYHYRYRSGHSGDWFVTGFAPRKRHITIYIMTGFDAYTDLLDRLGKHTTAKSCVYIKRLDDVDRVVLETLIKVAATRLCEWYDCE